MSYEEIEGARLQKRNKNGGFEMRVYSPFFEMDSDHPDIGYYLEKPHKYPDMVI